MNCSKVEGNADAVSAIEDTFVRWEEALVAGDVEAALDLVAEDAEFWSNTQPPLVGRSALRDAFAPLLAAYTLRQEFECVELIAAEGWALVRGTEVNRLTPKAGREEIVQRQRAFSVLRREADGAWRFARGMTNLPPDQG